MQQAIRERLSAGAAELIDEIESAAGIEIAVRQSQRGRLALPYEGNSEARIVFSHSEAIIEHDADIGNVSPESIVHELLHLRRAYVDSVPFLLQRRAIEFDTASAIDNDVEHLVIYRRQIELWPQSAATLDGQLAEYWTGRSWSSVGPKGLLFNHIVRFAATRLYGSSETRAAMRSALAAGKILSRIRTEAESVISVIADKRAMLGRIFDAVGISRQSFRLRVLYPRERRFEDSDF